MYSVNPEKLTVLSTAILLSLCLNTADAACTIPAGMTSCSENNNFTMLDSVGGSVGGTNDVTFAWDGTYKTSVVTNNTNNATLSSPTPFFGNPWTAHNINVYGPGTYIFDTSCPAGNPSCGDGGTDQYTLVIPSGYAGAHMLFNWSTSSDIDVVVLWDTDKTWNATSQSTSTTRDLFSTGGVNTNNNTGDTTWSFVSIDTSIDTDNKHGTQMVDGPFQGFQANFSVNISTGAAGAAVSNTVSLDVDDPKMPSSGCSISLKPALPGDGADWWLVAGFLAWLGALRMRSKRQIQF